MESFAYLHLAVDYEDPTPEPTVRSLKELGLTLPNSTWVGVASLMIAISIVATTHQAMALIVRGNTGPSVTAVQSALRSRGYSVGVDGVFGSQTQSVLQAFQRDRGLAADGVVGSATASALGVSSNGGGSGGGNSNTGAVTITAGSGVNIRSGPGTNYAIVGGLGSGARVSTFGSSNGWLRVNGGWISSAYTNGGGGGGGGSSPTGSVTVIPAIGVNIRSGPGTSYAVVGGLSGGARVSTFGTSGGWYRVSGGWVSGSHVQ